MKYGTMLPPKDTFVKVQFNIVVNWIQKIPLFARKINAKNCTTLIIMESALNAIPKISLKDVWIPQSHCSALNQKLVNPTSNQSAKTTSWLVISVLATNTHARRCQPTMHPIVILAILTTSTIYRKTIHAKNAKTRSQQLASKLTLHQLLHANAKFAEKDIL